MKKFAPAFVIIGIIIIGIVAFSVMQSTVSAPVEPEPTASTTETGTPGAPQGAAPGTSAPLTIKNVIKVYANPDWGFKLRYDTSWNLTQTGEVVNVDSPTASFMISPEQEIAEPARLEAEETTRVILGQSVTVTRFENPNERYAFYEYFTLRINKIEYYFKVLSTVEPNPRIEEFLGSLVLQ